jgi:UDPglucose 6-dehydrogenase
MKITVIGTGYVGLVSGTCLAEVGNDVLCLDVDPAKIKTLKKAASRSTSPAWEMVQRNVAAGRLHFTTDVERAGAFRQRAVHCGGHAARRRRLADMKYVTAAARNIGRYMTDYKVVVDKSTVPVGTADVVHKAIADELARRGVDTPFSVVSNPEFLKEGAAVEDFMRPDRIVVGCDDEQAAHYMRALYAPFSATASG